LSSTTPSASGRLASLDMMRGITMASMILVNNPGDWKSVHPPLLHASWHGCTPTDLVFPFFLFMVGAATAFALGRPREGAERQELVIKIVRRGAILFVIGFALGLFPSVFWDLSVLKTCRIPGVLQRIAICYVVTALLAIYATPRVQWTTAFWLILVYSLGMFLVPVPGHGRGSFEVEGNLCCWIDQKLLLGHTWSGAPAKGFDPEGVWSTLTAIAGTLFGLFAGKVLKSKEDPYPKLVTLFIAAQLALIAAYVASFWMPINKQLWTTSYLFLVTGLALNFLALLYWAIDVRGLRFGISFFVVFGGSSILAYVLSNVLGDVLGLIPMGQSDLKSWLVHDQFGAVLSPKNASLAWAILMVLTCWLVMWPLERLNWRVRI
jgi:predicted acyltransferase